MIQNSPLKEIRQILEFLKRHIEIHFTNLKEFADLYPDEARSIVVLYEYVKGVKQK